MDGKTFAVVRPIHDPSIKGQRQILEWQGSPSLGPCFHRRCFSFFFHLASAALRATLLEILEEYLLLRFEEEEESFLSFTLRPPIVWPHHSTTGLPLIYSFIMLFAGPVVNMNL